MKLIAATHNKGKIREFRRIFTSFGITVISQEQAGVDIQVEETGTTFMENAFIKAKAIYDKTGIPTIADDSGLCVEALNLRPGVYSARYAGENTPHTKKIAHLLLEMKDVPTEKRGAYFESAICCILDKDTVLKCSGRCYGTIGHQPVGENGFGYDPIFMVEGGSFGELSDPKKDEISHRGVALRELYKQLQEKLSEKA